MGNYRTDSISTNMSVIVTHCSLVNKYRYLEQFSVSEKVAVLDNTLLTSRAVFHQEDICWDLQLYDLLLSFKK